MRIFACVVHWYGSTMHQIYTAASPTSTMTMLLMTTTTMMTTMMTTMVLMMMMIITICWMLQAAKKGRVWTNVEHCRSRTVVRTMRSPLWVWMMRLQHMPSQQRRLSIMHHTCTHEFARYLVVVVVAFLVCSCQAVICSFLVDSERFLLRTQFLLRLCYWDSTKAASYMLSRACNTSSTWNRINHICAKAGRRRFMRFLRSLESKRRIHRASCLKYIHCNDVCFLFSRSLALSEFFVRCCHILAAFDLCNKHTQALSRATSSITVISLSLTCQQLSLSSTSRTQAKQHSTLLT